MADFTINVVVESDEAVKGIDEVDGSIAKLGESEDALSKFIADANNSLEKQGQTSKKNSKEFGVAGQAVDKFSKKIKAIPGDIGKFAAGALTGVLAGFAIQAIGKLFEPPSREDIERVANANEELVFMGQNLTKLAQDRLVGMKLEEHAARIDERQSGIRAKALEDAMSIKRAEEALRITKQSLLDDLRKGQISWLDYSRAVANAKKNLDDANGTTKAAMQAQAQLIAMLKEVTGIATKASEEAVERRKKGAEAFKQMRDEAHALRDEFDPLGAAGRELAATQDLVSRVMANGRTKVLSLADAYNILEGAEAKFNAARVVARGGGQLVDVDFDEQVDAAKAANEERRADDRRNYENSVELMERRGEKQKELDDTLKERNKQAVKDLAAQREAQAQALAGFFAPASNALTDLVMKGEADWGAMVDSMIRDLVRLAAEAAILNLFRGATGAPVGGQGTGLGALFGMAHGGQFTVGGSGGTDSQVTAFRSTPGEQVTVTTPAQQQAMGQQAAPVVRQKIVNVIDPRMAVDAMSSSEGERVTINHIRANASAIKALLR